MKDFSLYTKKFCVQSCINTYNGKWGAISWEDWDKHIKFNIGNNEGFMGYANVPDIGYSLVFVFQGSSKQDNNQDWKENFDFGKVSKYSNPASKETELVIPYGNESTKIRMHKGVLETHSYARDLIRSEVFKVSKSGLPILFVGHSLGGGLATAAYIDAHHYLHDELGFEDYTGLYGYALSSLKIGNKHFKKSFNQRSKGRFYNEYYCGDGVHDAPPYIFGYRHVGIIKKWCNVKDSILAFPFRVISPLTLGISLAFWNHRPKLVLDRIVEEIEKLKNKK